MKILFITPVLPGPAYGRRPFNFLKVLAPKHEATLLCLCSRPPEEKDLAPLYDFGVREIKIVLHPNWKGALAASQAFLKKQPLRVAFCESSALRQSLSDILATKEIDLVHIDRLRIGELARLVSGKAKCVVDFTDALELYCERVRKFERNPIARLVAKWDQYTIPSFERRLSDWFDACLLCSPIDADIVRRSIPPEKVFTIPNMVDTEEFKPKLHGGAPRLIFTGTWTYFPNRDSLFYYAEEILPEIRKRVPNAETLVIGARPDKKVMALDGHDGIRVVGPVPDMAAELFSDDVFVCPLRVGAGVRNKILEAMSVEMACVSTTLGAEGLPVTHERDILLLDSHKDFAEASVRLLTSPDDRLRIGRVARQTVIATHSTPVVAAQTEALYERLIL